MAIPSRIESFLSRHGASYDLVPHPESHSSIETAEHAHVPGDLLVKGVVLEDDEGALIAVLPSTRSIQMSHLGRDLNRRVRLADGQDLTRLFPDCRAGAVPPLGRAYGLRTIVDDELEAQPEVYFEAGDHENLVHMTGAQFMALLGPAERAHFAQRQRRTYRGV
jgi:Ala-tRNA(Pro) deacylase